MTGGNGWRPHPQAAPGLLAFADDARLLLIDDLLAEPEALRDWAVREGRFTTEMGGLYPGIRAPVPTDYALRVIALVDPLLRDAFGLKGVVRARADFNLSLVTAPPSGLHPFQCIPHIDSSAPLSFAMLHYLCEGAHGGTGFFRQRATGIARVTPDRESEWSEARDQALAARRDPPAYIGAQDPDYALIGSAEARWNRLLVYPGNLLHSGLIPEGAALSPDPATGRLTANIFLDYRPT